MVLEAFTDELMEGMIASEGVALADLEGVFFHGDGWVSPASSAKSRVKQLSMNIY